MDATPARSTPSHDRNAPVQRAALVDKRPHRLRSNSGSGVPTRVGCFPRARLLHPGGREDVRLSHDGFFRVNLYLELILTNAANSPGTSGLYPLFTFIG